MSILIKKLMVVAFFCSFIGCQGVNNINRINVDIDDDDPVVTVDTSETVKETDIKSMVIFDTIRASDTIKTVDTVEVEKLITVTDTTKTVDTIPELSDASSGFRYYRFVIDAINLGGSSCAIITETSFISDNSPVIEGYNLISCSDVSEANIIERDIPRLFDGDLSVGSDNAGYIKFTSAPWEWVIDMVSAQVYTSLRIASWETSYYHEPSQVSIYGSNDLTEWKKVGGKTFDKVYQSAIIPLTY